MCKEVPPVEANATALHLLEPISTASKLITFFRSACFTEICLRRLKASCQEHRLNTTSTPFLVNRNPAPHPKCNRCCEQQNQKANLSLRFGWKQ